MKSKYWTAGWLMIVCMGLAAIGVWVYKIDPYMHFHKPDTTRYFYTLNSQRTQNDGIIKYFEYDALITGTSMTENFKSSEMDEIFGCNSIKVPFFGGTYKEINDNLKTAVENNPALKIVVRGLDMRMFFDDKDLMRKDLGKYPTYLYDSNPLNDVQYIWNRAIIWNKVYSMTEAKNQEGFKAGITSFDDYSNWQYIRNFGIKTVCPDGIPETTRGEPVHLSDAEKETIAANITQNVTSLAKENPEITFYYFFTPYSAVWWRSKVPSGSIYKQIEAEEYVIEMILECDNIKLFSFNNRLDITCDLNNYRDSAHYAQWINSLILRWMYDGEYQITKENYKSYLETELGNYCNLDYASLNEQIDYERDFYAAALLNQELTGVQPIDLLETDENNIHLNKANIVENQYNETRGIECIGSLQLESGSKDSLYDYITGTEFIGAAIDVKSVDKYGYLVFYGKKVQDHGQPTVYVINDSGKKVGEIKASYQKIDSEWHQYVIDITKVKGDIRIIFNGGYVDSTGSEDSNYIFSGITLY